MELASAPGQRRNQSKNGIMRVPLNDGHVQIVQTLTEDIHDMGCDFAHVGVLQVSLGKHLARSRRLIHTLGLTLLRTTSSQPRR